MHCTVRLRMILPLVLAHILVSWVVQQHSACMVLPVDSQSNGLEAASRFTLATSLLQVFIFLLEMHDILNRVTWHSVLIRVWAVCPYKLA